MPMLMPVATVLLTFVLGTLGTLCLALLRADELHDRDGGPLAGFNAMLAGLATLSWVAMFLALAGVFSWPAVAAVLALLGAMVMWIRRRSIGRRSQRQGSLPGLLVAVVAVALFALAIGWIAAPVEAELASNDASIYFAIANRLETSGALSGIDAIAADMTAQERDALFANRFPKDSTGPYARFPGGVRLMAPDSAWVTFHFYHLWPVWLGLAMSVFGSPAALGVVPLFAALGLASLFLLGTQLASRAFGVACVAVLFATYPQLYYTRLPLSEIPGQAYFLGGLLCFVRAVQASGSKRIQFQLLATALWGCFCLSRADGMLFLIPALFAAFLLDADLRRSRTQWLPLGTGVILAVTLALIHQLAGGTYEDALRDLPSARAVFQAVSLAVAPREPAFIVIWAVIAVGALFVSVDVRAVRARRILSMLLVASFALVSVGWAILFVPQIDPAQILRHLEWLHLYLRGPMLACAFVGLAILVVFAIRNPAPLRLPRLLLPFLLVPLVGLLIAPMVTPTQPWAIRRFLPMAWPLLCLLALLGWRLALGAVRFSFAQNGAAFALVAIAAVAGLLSTSAFLLRRPMFEHLGMQVGRVAARIPGDALVLLPDEQAGMHLQVALDYANARPTLLLPFTLPEGESTEAAHRRTIMQAYVQRQVDSGRPVIALFRHPGVLPGWIAKDFSLQFAFTQPIAFSMPAQVPDLVFPGTIVKLDANYVAFRLAKDPGRSAPSQVGVGRPEEDLPFIVRGFGGPEGDPSKVGGTFRWALKGAELALPPVRKVRLYFRPWRPPQAPPLDLRVTVDGIPVAFENRVEQTGDHVLEVLVPQEIVQSRRRFVLNVDASSFSMQRLGLSNDPRELGIAIFRIDLVQ